MRIVMRGTALGTMAWRNLWRNRRRTLLTLSSIVFGVFLAVLTTAMQDRNWDDMINLAARLGGGHVTVQHPEYLDTPTFTRTVEHTDEIRRLALADPDARRVVERIVGPTMLNTAGESYAAAFIALDPTAEDESTLSLVEAIAQGELFTSPDDGGILLGERLAQNLGVEMGERIVYTLTDRQGEIVSGLARLSGLVKSGAPTVDGGLALLPIDAVREVLGYAPDEATQVAVFVDDQRRSDLLAERLGQALGPGVAVLPWHRLQPELAGFIAMKVGGARVMEVVIALLVAAGIFNTLFVSVMERLREFGVMLAIGWSSGRLFRLVMLESLWLGLLGLVGAALFTIGPYLYLAHTGIDVSALLGDDANTEVAGVAIASTLRVGIFPQNAVLIGVSALVATLLSGLYPAWRAGRVDPVEVLQIV